MQLHYIILNWILNNDGFLISVYTVGKKQYLPFKFCVMHTIQLYQGSRLAYIATHKHVQLFSFLSTLLYVNKKKVSNTVKTWEQEWTARMNFLHF